jgi:hypothetical protein
MNSHRDSNLVPKLARLFGFLRRLTLMSIIQRLFPSTQNNDPFIDKYVILFPLLPLLLIPLQSIFWVSLFTFVFGIWRIFEILVFIANTYLFDEYRARMQGEEAKPFGGFRRVLVLTLFNYAELILWFAAFYRNLIPELAVTSINSVIESINYSFVTMTAFGNTSIEPMTWQVTLISMCQSIIGLFMTLAVIARSVSLLPVRETADPFE